MEYYSFPIGSETFNKYKEFNQLAYNELETVYKRIRPLGAIGVYRNDSEVLGVVFNKDKELDSSWVMLKEEGNRVIYIPQDEDLMKDTLITTQYTNEKLKEDLFHIRDEEYLVCVLLDKWLRVETSCVLPQFKEYKASRLSFKNACKKYKKNKQKM